ncbi:MAG: non-homologous end-joining DNA ligase [Actinomycetota bacterium]|nr:non-homologous end-joining DNA ligase [Actinomycetota bacterium]
MAGEQKVRVRVGERTLAVTNLQKILYPEIGWSKADVIDYYATVGPTMLPYVQGRPVTFKRYPDGVEGPSFFEKNSARNAPEWLSHAVLPATRSTKKDRTELDYAILDDLPSIVWAANLAALELHVPQWRVGAKKQPLAPDLMVFDLDPGPPATIVECARVAVLVREVLAEDGMTAYAKTSGSKGMQLYVGVKVRDPERTSGYAKALAERLAGENPDLIVSQMKKELRPGKVFIDWSQNSPAKTTVAPYSLRARPEPTVSTPITWDEVDGCQSAADLRFLASDVLARVEKRGDLFNGLLTEKSALP